MTHPTVLDGLTHPTRRWTQQNADAHRSTISGPAGFALALQEENPHEAVTFVSVANSVASISQGLLGPMLKRW